MIFCSQSSYLNLNKENSSGVLFYLELYYQEPAIYICYHSYDLITDMDAANVEAYL